MKQLNYIELENNTIVKSYCLETKLNEYINKYQIRNELYNRMSLILQYPNRYIYRIHPQIIEERNANMLLFIRVNDHIPQTDLNISQRQDKISVIPTKYLAKQIKYDIFHDNIHSFIAQQVQSHPNHLPLSQIYKNNIQFSEKNINFNGNSINTDQTSINFDDNCDNLDQYKVIRMTIDKNISQNNIRSDQINNNFDQYNISFDQLLQLLIRLIKIVVQIHKLGIYHLDIMEYNFFIDLQTFKPFIISIPLPTSQIHLSKRELILADVINLGMMMSRLVNDSKIQFTNCLNNEQQNNINNNFNNISNNNNNNNPHHNLKNQVFQVCNELIECKDYCENIEELVLQQLNRLKNIKLISKNVSQIVEQDDIEQQDSIQANNLQNNNNNNNNMNQSVNNQILWKGIPAKKILCLLAIIFLIMLVVVVIFGQYNDEDNNNKKTKTSFSCIYPSVISEEIIKRFRCAIQHDEEEFNEKQLQMENLQYLELSFKDLFLSSDEVIEVLERVQTPFLTVLDIDLSGNDITSDGFVQLMQYFGKKQISDSLYLNILNTTICNLFQISFQDNISSAYSTIDELFNSYSKIAMKFSIFNLQSQFTGYFNAKRIIQRMELNGLNGLKQSSINLSGNKLNDHEALMIIFNVFGSFDYHYLQQTLFDNRILQIDLSDNEIDGFCLIRMLKACIETRKFFNGISIDISNNPIKVEHYKQFFRLIDKNAELKYVSLRVDIDKFLSGIELFEYTFASRSSSSSGVEYEIRLNKMSPEDLFAISKSFVNSQLSFKINLYSDNLQQIQQFISSFPLGNTYCQTSIPLSPPTQFKGVNINQTNILTTFQKIQSNNYLCYQDTQQILSNSYPQIQDKQNIQNQGYLKNQYQQNILSFNSPFSQYNQIKEGKNYIQSENKQDIDTHNYHQQQDQENIESQEIHKYQGKEDITQYQDQQNIGSQDTTQYQDQQDIKSYGITQYQDKKIKDNDYVKLESNSFLKQDEKGEDTIELFLIRLEDESDKQIISLFEQQDIAQDIYFIYENKQNNNTNQLFRIFNPSPAIHFLQMIINISPLILEDNIQKIVATGLKNIQLKRVELITDPFLISEKSNNALFSLLSEHPSLQTAEILIKNEPILIKLKLIQQKQTDQQVMDTLANHLVNTKSLKQLVINYGYQQWSLFRSIINAFEQSATMSKLIISIDFSIFTKQDYIDFYHKVRILLDKQKRIEIANKDKIIFNEGFGEVRRFYETILFKFRQVNSNSTVIIDVNTNRQMLDDLIDALDSLQSNQISVIVTNYTFSNIECFTLLSKLSNNTYLHSIIFQTILPCKLPSKQLANIIDQFAQNHNLTYLQLNIALESSNSLKKDEDNLSEDVFRSVKQIINGQQSNLLTLYFVCSECFSKRQMVEIIKEAVVSRHLQKGNIIGMQITQKEQLTNFAYIAKDSFKSIYPFNENNQKLMDVYIEIVQMIRHPMNYKYYYLDLSYSNINDREVTNMKEYLNAIGQKQKLFYNFSDNKISNQGIYDFSQTLISQTSLHTLNLILDNNQFSDEGCTTLMQAIHSISQTIVLFQLSLESNQLGVKCLQSILNTIPFFHNLKQISLIIPETANSSLVRISEELTKVDRLETVYLNVQDQYLSLEEAQKIGTILGKKLNIKQIKIKSKYEGDIEMFFKLNQIINRSKLFKGIYLEISNSIQFRQSVEPIFKQLSQDDTILDFIYLDISSNNLDDQSMPFITDFINNKQLNLSKLELNLSQNLFTQQTCVLLSDSISNLPELQSLSLNIRYNLVQFECIQVLAIKIQKMKQIQQIRIYFYTKQITQEEQKQIKELFPQVSVYVY